MTDPVATAAEHKLRIATVGESGQIEHWSVECWCYLGRSHFGLSTELPNEVERLRAVIENAPHDSGCQFSFLPEGKPRRCTCWKADAL